MSDNKTEVNELPKLSIDDKDYIEVQSRADEVRNKVYWSRTALYLGGLTALIMYSVVLLSDGVFDPKLFLYLPFALTLVGGVATIWLERVASKKKVAINGLYMSWLRQKLRRGR